MNTDIHYMESTFTVKGYGVKDDKNGTLIEMDVERPMISDHEVIVEVMYCGVCHSDIHQVYNDWKNSRYPCVPGHEVIGKIINKGNKVTGWNLGDFVGIGCMIDSCRVCKACKNDEEQFCTGPHGATMTYNGYFADPESDFNTYGGYASHLVSSEDFLIKIPDQMDLQKVGPILCAGITTYSPLKHWGVQKGDKVAVVGIGGLGHMAVQIAKAMGAKVTAITSEKSKKGDIKALGADAILLSTDENSMEKAAMKFDFILITIPTKFDINPYISLVAPRGGLVTVGLLDVYQSATNNMEVAKYARSVGGSIIGGIKETQEAMDFCSKHNILPDVELIEIEQINEAFQKVLEEDVRFRYVIDMKA